MKNHVSEETAKALRSAGFPQPTMDYGQLWYQGNLSAFVARRVYTSNGIPISILRDDQGATASGEIFFAPTATDILQELGNDYCIKADNSGFECILGSRISRNPQAWAHSSSQSVSFLLRYHHENPAEACAQAWLAKKSKERAFVQHQ